MRKKKRNSVLLFMLFFTLVFSYKNCGENKEKPKQKTKQRAKKDENKPSLASYRKVAFNLTKLIKYYNIFFETMINNFEEKLFSPKLLIIIPF